MASERKQISFLSEAILLPCVWVDMRQDFGLVVTLNGVVDRHTFKGCVVGEEEEFCVLEKHCEFSHAIKCVCLSFTGFTRPVLIICLPLCLCCAVDVLGDCEDDVAWLILSYHIIIIIIFAA